MNVLEDVEEPPHVMTAFVFVTTGTDMSRPTAAAGERSPPCFCPTRRSTGSPRLHPNPRGVIVRRTMVTGRSAASTGTRRNVEMSPIPMNLTTTLNFAGSYDSNYFLSPNIFLFHISAAEITSSATQRTPTCTVLGRR